MGCGEERSNLKKPGKEKKAEVKKCGKEKSNLNQANKEEEKVKTNSKPQQTSSYNQLAVEMDGCKEVQWGD